jgi:hypothetical protein
VAPKLPRADCPVPMPVVVQPAIAIAKSDAAAALIDTELMVSLLSSPQRMTAIAAPRVNQSSFR